MSSNIKKLNKNDLNDAIELIYELTVSNNTSTIIKKDLKSKKLFTEIFSEAFFEMEMFGYFDSNKLVGLIGIENNNYITNLYVNKNYQNMSIGTCLLNYVKEYLKDKTDILEVCSLKFAVEFYQKNDFICYSDNNIDKAMMYYKGR